MADMTAVIDETSEIFPQFSFRKTVAAEHNGEIRIKDDRRELDRQKRLFERERREFTLKKEQAEKQMEQQKHLFEMKWKILEKELMSLASEKEELERKKAYYEKLEAEANGKPEIYEISSVVTGEGFFCGVGSASSLKKRYKDLIKIYHPDNVAGDNGMIQRINREYDALKKQFA